MTRDQGVCELCHGFGWVTIAGDELSMTSHAYPNQTIPVERKTRCACYLAKAAQRRLVAAGIPAKYQACTFENFKAYNDPLRDALGITRALASRYPFTPDPAQTNGRGGLLLIGPAGVGKTHLVAALLASVIARTGMRGVFFTNSTLLQLIRSSYNATTQTTEARILAPVVTCDLLVLDDVGNVRVTDWVLDTINYVIDARYSSGLPVVCTTNFPDLDDDTHPESLAWRVGFRMHSRLHEMCRFVSLEGADYRDTDGSELDLRTQWKRRRKHTLTRKAPGPRPTPKDGKEELPWPGGKGGNT